jgi:hypothetical protein
MLKNIFMTKSPESKFWTWFEKENKRFLNIQNLDKRLLEKHLDEILSELHKYDDNLGIQLGGKSKEKTELIITAAGNVEYFDKVNQLVGAAPSIDKWEIIALMPPVDFNNLDFDNYSISIDDLSFSETLLDGMELDEIAVTIKVRDYDKKRDYDSFKSAIHKVLATLITLTLKIGTRNVNPIFRR